MSDDEMQAVWVIRSDGERRLIDNVASAVRYMVNNWPAQHMFSGAYIAAQTAALDVSAGDATVDEFRQAFEDAARQAGVLAWSGED